ncbi:MAG: dethiobiotin synthase [Polyangiaceae bacterium]
MGILIVTGTGTEIGKTHVSEAILLCEGRGRSVLGYKPVESGTAPGSPTADSARLAAASSFHVKHPPAFRFDAPVSPHLAARLEGTPIDISVIREKIRELTLQVDLLLVELAGGLFSPLTDDRANADLVRAIEEEHPSAKTLLIAPDRLGVLHDVAATALAAETRGARLDAIVLNAPELADASTGTNMRELSLVTPIPVLGVASRTRPPAMADSAVIRYISSILLHF